MATASQTHAQTTNSIGDDFQPYDTIHLTGRQFVGNEDSDSNNTCGSISRCYLFEFEPNNDAYQLYQKPLVASTLYKGDVIIFMGYRRIPIMMAPWSHIKDKPFISVAIFLFNGRLCWMDSNRFDKLCGQIIGRSTGSPEEKARKE